MHQSCANFEDGANQTFNNFSTGPLQIRSQKGIARTAIVVTASEPGLRRLLYITPITHSRRMDPRRGTIPFVEFNGRSSCLSGCGRALLPQGQSFAAVNFHAPVKGRMICLERGLDVTILVQ